MKVVVEKPAPEPVIVISLRQADDGVYVEATGNGSRGILFVIQDDGVVIACSHLPTSLGFKTTSTGKIMVK